MAQPDLNVTVVKFMDAVKVMDSEAIAALTVQENDSISSALQPDEDEDGEFGGAIMKAAFSSMSYRIGTAVVSGDTATVPLKIRCVDIADVLKKAMARAMGLAFRMIASGKSAMDVQTRFEKTLVDAFKGPKAKMTERDAALTLRKTNDK